MSDNKKIPVDVKTLMQFVPLDALTPQNIQELSKHSYLLEISQGREIFSNGGREHECLFLVEGTIELHDGDKVTALSSDSKLARHAIAANKPRSLSCIAKTDAKLVVLDSDLLDILVTWDQTAGYEVQDISADDDTDWMTSLLQIEIMQQLPAANIQSLFMSLERVPVSTGEYIIRQGDEGDYFYILLEGSCKVLRSSPRTNEDILLAELHPGDSFGEEALISEAKRNASIVMASDGVIMRLAKDKFLELMQAPLQQMISFADAEKMVAAGAVWLDVRMPSEFSNEHYPGAINMPLYFLRKDLGKLDPDRSYIVYCDSGRRSSSAAYLLAQRGYQVGVLQGGMQAAHAA